jgi:hypothetical protein
MRPNVVAFRFRRPARGHPHLEFKYVDVQTHFQTNGGEFSAIRVSKNAAEVSIAPAAPSPNDSLSSALRGSLMQGGNMHDSSAKNKHSWAQVSLIAKPYL